ncbi:hypothetical protein [Arcanobacterium ihumii]|uniref:hypothetical protein n=1 Tax=Arcanobacterium ihumii TaxID=2138162 RepID=UPI000F520EAC|nr:hypothetical protein [Arcanobacterium ihumii]
MTADKPNNGEQNNPSQQPFNSIVLFPAVTVGVIFILILCAWIWRSTVFPFIQCKKEVADLYSTLTALTEMLVPLIFAAKAFPALFAEKHTQHDLFIKQVRSENKYKTSLDVVFYIALLACTFSFSAFLAPYVSIVDGNNPLKIPPAPAYLIVVNGLLFVAAILIAWFIPRSNPLPIQQFIDNFSLLTRIDLAAAVEKGRIQQEGPRRLVVSAFYLSSLLMATIAVALTTKIGPAGMLLLAIQPLFAVIGIEGAAKNKIYGQSKFIFLRIIFLAQSSLAALIILIIIQKLFPQSLITPSSILGVFSLLIWTAIIFYPKTIKSIPLLAKYYQWRLKRIKKIIIEDIKRLSNRLRKENQDVRDHISEEIARIVVSTYKGHANSNRSSNDFGDISDYTSASEISEVQMYADKFWPRYRVMRRQHAARSLNKSHSPKPPTKLRRR